MDWNKIGYQGRKRRDTAGLKWEEVGGSRAVCFKKLFRRPAPLPCISFSSLYKLLHFLSLISRMGRMI
jgi:hypothetical protein